MISLSEQAAFSCCASPAWSRHLAGCYPDFDALLNKARASWWKEVNVLEWLVAFSAHPKIGEIKAEELKPAFATFSRAEQAAATQSATSDVAAELQRWNKSYYDKFGFIFIICAKVT